MGRGMRVAYVGVLALLVVVVGAGLWFTRDTRPDVVVPPEVRSIEADPTVVLNITVEVPASSNGCPAHRFHTPRDPVLPPSTTDSSVRIPLGRGAVLLTACLGPIEGGRTLEHLVTVELPDSRVALYGELGVRPPALSVERVDSAHGSGFAVTSRFGEQLLTDHYVVVDGVVHVVGHLRPADRPGTGWPVVATVLASWEWRP